MNEVTQQLEEMQRKLLQALELIAVGDVEYPKEFAHDTLIELGFWEKREPIICTVPADDPETVWAKDMVSYAHVDDPDGIRYRQFASEVLPPWAVNIEGMK